MTPAAMLVVVILILYAIKERSLVIFFNYQNNAFKLKPCKSSLGGDMHSYECFLVNYFLPLI